jgi:hypothetical protein
MQGPAVPLVPMSRFAELEEERKAEEEERKAERKKRKAAEKELKGAMLVVCLPLVDAPGRSS